MRDLWTDRDHGGPSPHRPRGHHQRGGHVHRLPGGVFRGRGLYPQQRIDEQRRQYQHCQQRGVSGSAELRFESAEHDGEYSDGGLVVLHLCRDGKDRPVGDGHHYCPTILDGTCKLPGCRNKIITPLYQIKKCIK